MTNTKIEFAVQMTCNSCVEAVRKSLQNVVGISDVYINLEKKQVVVDTNLPTLRVQELLETSGRKVRIKGHGGTTAGVAILDAGIKGVQGVVRFVQATENRCILDGTIDGLPQGIHQMAIHECGDLSNGCSSVGNVYTNDRMPQPNSRIYGDLGTVEVGTDNRITFRKEDTVVSLSNIIGRSLVIINGTNNERLACGIIARSAGLFQNPKMICACDGVTIWDERKDKKINNNINNN